jgi:D-alanyl-D-alanine-carboxypeptidase/D-alanyl-D-alanine-endopeptidase
MNSKDINRTVASFVLLAAGAMAQPSTTPPVRSGTEIRKILADRIGAENNGSGIVVGIVDANGRRIVAYGSLAKNDNGKLDGDSVFESAQ